MSPGEFPTLWPVGEAGFPAAPPLPGAAVFFNPLGGAIVVTNALRQELVGSAFCVGPLCRPAPGFQEHYRTRFAPVPVISQPIVLPDGTIAVGL